jgi:hypothetical protein
MGDRQGARSHPSAEVTPRDETHRFAMLLRVRSVLECSAQFCFAPKSLYEAPALPRRAAGRALGTGIALKPGGTPDHAVPFSIVSRPTANRLRM